MTSIERDGESFVVPAGLLAEAFGLSEDEVRAQMRAEKITALSEVGVGADEGRWRLSFYFGNRACGLVVDGNGTVLKRIGFPARRPTAPDRPSAPRPNAAVSRP